jgi:uncharacterized protein YyaL (SSP411 family)
MDARRSFSVARTLVAVVLAVAPVAADATGDEDALPSPDWVGSLDEALRLAAEGDRPVLVDVFADWCQPCHIMERETYAHPDVIEALGSFVAFKLDAEVEGDRADRYGVSILPTTLVLEPNGRLVIAVPGQLGPDAMLRLVRGVQAGWSDYRAAMGHPGDADAMERAAGYLVGLGNFEGAARALQLAVMQLRAANAPPTRVHEMELKIAQARLADGAWREAEAEFNRLARTGAAATIRAMALVGLADSAQQRGLISVAERFRRQVREQYPEIAARLDL